MRLLTLLALLAAACCGSTSPADLAPDLSVFDNAPACPPGAEELSTAKCSYGVDTLCRSQLGGDCRCLCTGYWECDLVKAVCDGGTPGD